MPPHVAQCRTVSRQIRGSERERQDDADRGSVPAHSRGVAPVGGNPSARRTSTATDASGAVVTDRTLGARSLPSIAALAAASLGALLGDGSLHTSLRRPSHGPPGTYRP